jgi:hypothetical protein
VDAGSLEGTTCPQRNGKGTQRQEKEEEEVIDFQHAVNLACLNIIILKITFTYI